ncbi:MAG: hypothetical protein J6V13_03055 [Paludibacteraceae bacterium]|nr:hypothetical protein [Paludibacteraceae bacterium]
MKRMIMFKRIYVRYAVVLVVVACCSACEVFRQKTEGKPIVEVSGNFLYEQDLRKVIPHGVNEEDSTRIAQRFIKRWATDVLMHEAAKRNVANEAHIERMVADYKKDLLLHEYERRIVAERLNRDVSEEELTEFYEQYATSMRLTEAIVKGLLIVLPHQAPHMDEVKKWVNQPDSDAVDKIEKYVVQNAVSYDYFMDRWIPFSEVRRLLPQAVEQADDFLKTHNGFVQFSDSLKTGLLFLKESKLTGEVRPYDYAREEIKELLINRRKVELVQKLEQDIYEEAMQNGDIVLW